MTLMHRRRFLTIAAACAALPAHAKASTVAHWRGRALGAGATMQLAGVGEAQAAAIFAEVEQDLVRLEAIFSLYHPESEISRLNRDGSLEAPSPELLSVLSLCSTLNDVTDGVFDPTIQPLWLAIANGAAASDLAQARRVVSWDRLHFDARRIWFEDAGDRPAITLNGIAQGAITDRIAALLRARGLRDVLIDMGEIVALGSKADGADWSVGVADPAGTVIRRMTLKNRAIATSAPRGTLIGPNHDHAHIIGPEGDGEPRVLVSVSAPDAVLADGLSTALCLMDPTRGKAVLAHFPRTRLEIDA